MVIFWGIFFYEVNLKDLIFKEYNLQREAVILDQDVL